MQNVFRAWLIYCSFPPIGGTSTKSDGHRNAFEVGPDVMNPWQGGLIITLTQLLRYWLVTYVTQPLDKRNILTAK